VRTLRGSRGRLLELGQCSEQWAVAAGGEICAEGGSAAEGIATVGGRRKQANLGLATVRRSHTQKKNGCSVTNTTHKHMPDTHTYAH